MPGNERLIERLEGEIRTKDVEIESLRRELAACADDALTAAKALGGTTLTPCVSPFEPILALCDPI